MTENQSIALSLMGFVSICGLPTIALALFMAANKAGWPVAFLGILSLLLTIPAYIAGEWISEFTFCIYCHKRIAPKPEPKEPQKAHQACLDGKAIMRQLNAEGFKL